jgi:protein phosphatase PTC1
MLAVTRAFGDTELKPWVSAEPFISETELKPEDTYLIVACDGLWDVCSDQEAVDMVLEMSKKSMSPQSMSDHLLQYSLEHKTTDNVSVIVIQL